MADTSPEKKELQAHWKADTTVPELTLKDVSKHRSKSDLWIVIHGKVYNVTEYARDHPGGADALREVAGADATSAYEDVGHSEDAREIMHSLLVGVIQGASDEASGASVERPGATAEKPNVRIVRRQAQTDRTTHRHNQNVLRMELAAFACGTVALVYFVGHLHVPVPSHLPHTGGFTTGFLIATATCAAVGAMAYRQIARSLFGGMSFTQYPAHKHSSDSISAVAAAHHPAGFLRPQDYQSLTLTKKQELAKDIYRFVFALPTTYSILGLPIGQHVTIRAEVEDHVVSRSYTPVSNNRDLGRLELVIRCYPDGKLTGGYLAKIKEGDKVDFRGPKGAMRYRKGMSKRVGMIAGGTGITPMYQLIRAVCEDKTDATEVSLIYANRTEDDILLRKQLDRFEVENPGKFKVYYVLDHPPDGWKGGKGYITKDMIQERLCGPQENNKLLLCGPPGMVNASKKNLIELGFEAPGAVSKITDQIFCF